jgi:hypothetical protein
MPSCVCLGRMLDVGPLVLPPERAEPTGGAQRPPAMTQQREGVDARAMTHDQFSILVVVAYGVS